MLDRKNRIKTMAVLFAAVISLFLVRGGHASLRTIAPCTITGTPGPDLLVGTAHRDVICGLGGDDLISGLKGSDVIRGGPGNDKLQADSGRDVVYGGSGNDLAYCYDGFVDRIDGGLGTDYARFDRTLDRVRHVERFG